MFDLMVIGGGAAGIFGAISAKSAGPKAKVILLEKTAVLLAKVRVSGGGRCNVTHSCFDPKALVQNYPRGARELLGPFHRFGPRDTINWFEKRGVSIKTEKDGRMFPVTNSSETIIQTLLSEAEKIGVEIVRRQKIERIEKLDDHFVIHRKDDSSLACRKLLLATGSNKEGYAFARGLGHHIIDPIPSLFTFNVPTSDLKELSGVSVPDCEVRIQGTRHKQRGPLLITHFGFSGPAIIKLSAFAAKELFEKNYKAELIINWTPGSSPMPKRLLKHFLNGKREEELSKKEKNKLHEKLKNDRYLIEGKTTHKEEFVTCGGIDLKQVDFKTMESKLCPGLYFAGEILNIDGITGGFNFQNAWTTGYLSGINI